MACLRAGQTIKNTVTESLKTEIHMNRNKMFDFALSADSVVLFGQN